MRRGLVGALSALAALSLPALAEDAAPTATILSRSVWAEPDPDFGGFSGIEMAADGSGFLAIGDRGLIVTARIRRDGDRIAEIALLETRPLAGPDGRPLDEDLADAEGLALSESGRPVVSFEGRPRIFVYGTKETASLPLPPAFRALPPNGGIEALAIAKDGTLYAIPERSGRLTRPFPVWRLAEGRWTQPFTLPRSGGFVPVGADFGPDGALYLLERAFNGWSFRSRIRQIRIAGDRVSDDRVVFTSAFGAQDNLEGLSAWRDGQGRLRLTLISDDNHSPLQRTEILELALEE